MSDYGLERALALGACRPGVRRSSLLACLVGIVGTIVPVLPGSVLVGGAIVVWAVVEGGASAWVTAVLAVRDPRRRVRAHDPHPRAPHERCGHPNRTLVVGGLLGIAGFFVVPVVGLPLGFVLGVYLAERVRLADHAAAWPSTVTAMKGTGLSVLIGLAATVLATTVWAAVAGLT